VILADRVAEKKRAHLSWRPAPERRSLGELARHISLGRITWLARMSAPGIDAVIQRIPRWHTDDDGTRRVAEESVLCDDAALLAERLVLSWQPIRRVLTIGPPTEVGNWLGQRHKRVTGVMRQLQALTNTSSRPTWGVHRGPGGPPHFAFMVVLKLFRPAPD